MIFRFSEAIRKWAGWCPNINAAPVRERTSTFEMRSSAVPGNTPHLNGKGIVDYGSTGISIPLFILSVAGVVVAFHILRLANSLIAGILLSVFILAVAAIELYHDRNGNTVEVIPDSILVRRPLFKPLVIARDAIVKIEVRKNKLPVPLSVFAAVILAIIIFSVFRIYNELILFDQGVNDALTSLVSTSLYLSIVIFFICTFHRSYVRSRYPRLLAITTRTKKIIAVYVDDPYSVQRALEDF